MLATTDPLAKDFAAPGEPLLWPGEFVLGYPRKVPGSTDPLKTQTDAVPGWMKNGSYLVFRKLRQDVAGFSAAVQAEWSRLRGTAGFEDFTTERIGACIVGRWRSGAPLMRAPLADNPTMGDDANASNSFFYARNTPAVTYDPALGHAPDPLPLAQKDGDGGVCPLSAHIRKVNPRDEITEQGSSVRTLEHRIIRRGVPFGPDYDPSDPMSATEPRGLLFVCYQRSIVDGFEFLQHNWANSATAPHDSGGRDLVIGRGSPRELRIKAGGGRIDSISIASFVYAEGAAYLFAPGRQALVDMSKIEA
jgi:Dyp-type peroxidase family